MMSLFKMPHTPYATMSYSPWSIYKKDVMEKKPKSRIVVVQPSGGGILL